MRNRILCLVGSILLTFSIQAKGQKLNTDDQGVFLSGYDVVAYHKSGPQKGKSRYQLRHKGVKFYFSSKTNRSRFKANPEKFLPKYGGWCAFAMANKNARVPVNPETFKVIKGRTYLFFNGPFQGKNFNTRVPWNKNEKLFRRKADSNWTKMKKS